VPRTCTPESPHLAAGRALTWAALHECIRGMYFGEPLDRRPEGPGIRRPRRSRGCRPQIEFAHRKERGDAGIRSFFASQGGIAGREV
jgi:hypothetical protein